VRGGGGGGGGGGVFGGGRWGGGGGGFGFGLGLWFWWLGKGEPHKMLKIYELLVPVYGLRISSIPPEKSLHNLALASLEKRGYLKLLPSG